MLKSVDIKVTLPEELILSIGLPKEKLTEEIKRIYLFDLFSKRKISSGKAAEILGMTKAKFIDLLGENDISYFDYSEDEWIDEMKTVDKLLKKVNT